MTLASRTARRFAAASALLVATTASGAPAPPSPQRAAVAVPSDEVRSPTPPLDVSDRVIRKAIVDSREPADDVRPAGRAAFGSEPAARARRVDRAFDDAAVPTCLTPEAFKHDRPVIGAFGLGGFLALPWWAHAILTGRCRR